MNKILFVLLFILYPTMTLPSVIGGSGSTIICAGFSPNPCSRIDTNVQNISSASNNPTLGIPIIDPDFGNRITRLTNSTTDSPLYGCCAGDASAEDNEWSKYDSTMFSGDGGYRIWIKNDQGYNLYVGLDSKTMSSCMYANSSGTLPAGQTSCGTFLTNGLDTNNHVSGWVPQTWDQIDPCIVYGYVGRTAGSNNLLVKYNICTDLFYTSSNTTQNTPTGWIDWSTCPNTPTILPSTGQAYVTSVTVRAGRYASAIVGGFEQGWTTLAFWEDKSGPTCYWYDTFHGQYGGTGISSTYTTFGQIPQPSAPTFTIGAGSTNVCVELTALSDVNSQTTANVAGDSLPSTEVCKLGSIASGNIAITPAGGFSNPDQVAEYGCSVYTDVSPCTPYRIWIGVSGPGSEFLQTEVGTSGHLFSVSGSTTTIAVTNIVTSGTTPPTVQSSGYNTHQGVGFWDGSGVNLKGALASGAFWQILPSISFNPCTVTVGGISGATCTGGHSVGGTNHFVNNGGISGNLNNPYSTVIRPYNNQASVTNLISPLPSGTGSAHTDIHYSWNDAGANDSNPIGGLYLGTGVGNGSTNLNSNLCTSNQSVGWGNEIVLLSNDGTNRVWRFGHHRGGACLNPNSDSSAGVFNNSSPIGNISQDGRFYLFSSTFGWGLGNDISGISNPSAYPSTTWQSGHTYATGSIVYDGTNFEINNGSSGVSGGSTPSWAITSGGTTTDGTVTWTMFISCTDINNPGTGLPCKYDVFAIELK